MSLENEKREAQIITYIQKVIVNASINYYKKKFREVNNEMPVEKIEDFFPGSVNSVLQLPSLIIFGQALFLDDDEIAKKISLLNEREKLVLFEKFFLGKTDKEIGKTLGITRQGVTNLKHRIYKKLRKKKEEHDLNETAK